MSLLSDLIVFSAVTLSILFFLWLRKRLNYFKNNNVPYLKSPPLLGAMCDSILGKSGLYETSEKIYKNPKLKGEPFFGIFMFHKPAILVRDPELIKRILIKDFSSFSNHHSFSDNHDPLGIYNLFSSKDAVWRAMRKMLSPFFTSGKMKKMFSMIDEISENLLKHIEAKSNGKEFFEISIKDTTALYTIDVIGSCAFGIDAKCLENPNAEFMKIGHKIFDFTFHRGIEFAAMFLLPEITKFLNLKLFTEEGEKFIMHAIKDIIEQREKSGEKRNDLIDTLIEIKNSNATLENGEKISFEMLVAQAAVFLSAGHETSATAVTFTLYELAKHPDVQRKVREELQEMMKKNEGKVTYELALHDTPYLHQVVSEILRMYPVIPFLDRECTNPNGYSLAPYSEFVIPHKMPVYIPLYALHRDEQHFEEPLKFKPERFSPENIRKITSCTYIPFGTGNRLCIGERLGLLQAKTAIIKILGKYRVELTPTTPREIQLAKNAIIIQSDVPLVLKFVKDILN